MILGYWRLHIFVIFPEKHGNEVYLLLADKHKSFLEVDSITYLCNSWKKTLGLEFVFCMQINIKVSKLLEVARHVQSTQNYIFCRDILPGSSHAHCYLFIYKVQDISTIINLLKILCFTNIKDSAAIFRTHLKWIILTFSHKHKKFCLWIKNVFLSK